MECLSSEHTPIVVLGALALVLYPVGVPLLFLQLLRAARPAIVSSKPTRLSKAIGSLHRYYEVNYYAWEVVEAARKFLLVGFARLLEPGSLERLFC